VLSAAVPYPFLPKSGATVAGAQKSITRLQHFLYSITQCHAPVRCQRLSQLFKEPACPLALGTKSETGRSANAVRVPLIARPSPVFPTEPHLTLPLLRFSSPSRFQLLLDTASYLVNLHLLFIDCFPREGRLLFPATSD
jgi:hypothetical protein